MSNGSAQNNNDNNPSQSNNNLATESIDGPWHVLVKFGRPAVISFIFIYVLCGVCLFTYSRIANVDFEYPPGIKLGERDTYTTPEKDISATLLVERVLGKKPDGSAPLAQVFTDSRTANRRISDLFLNARSNIKIVTVHGRSWIQELEVDSNFKSALKRANINLLVVDPLGDGFNALSASRIRGLEQIKGDERLSPLTFKTAFDAYRSIVNDPEYGGRLHLRYYRGYPWIRFSIFDNKQATFTLVPFLQPGIEAPSFYSDDPWVIECLNNIFEDMKRSSRVIESHKDYESLFQESPDQS